MARVNKFNPVNLNDLYGKKETTVKPPVSGSGTVARTKTSGHGGMLVLTRPVKQQPKLGVGSLGPLKKEGTESGNSVANAGASWIKEENQQKPEGSDVKLDSAGITIKRDVYVPPAVRAAQNAAVVTAPAINSGPVSVADKEVLLRGEEFPTLQAAVAPANSNVGQQRSKDAQRNQRDKELVDKQQEKLLQLSLQSNVKGNHNFTDASVEKFQPMRPQYLRQPPVGAEQNFPKSVDDGCVRSEGRSSFAPNSDQHISEWTDDERADGNNVKPASNSNWRLGSGYGSFETKTNVISAGRLGRDSSSRPGSAGHKYDYERFPRPGSGEGRFERDVESHVVSETGGGYDLGRSTGIRPERELSGRPGSGGERFARPDSGYRQERGESMYRPPSGSRYERDVERESMPRPPSGGARYERETVARSPSGGRYDRETLPRPSSGGGYYSRPGSGGNRYDRDSSGYRPPSGGRHEKEVLARSNYGGGYNSRPGNVVERDREAPYRPGSGGRYEREEISRPGSGDTDYGRSGAHGYDSRHVRPSSGGNDYNQSGFMGSRYMQPGPGGKDRQPREGYFDTDPARPLVSDAPNRRQSNYDSTREKGAFKDSWFRPGGGSREPIRRDDYRQSYRQTGSHGRVVSAMAHSEDSRAESVGLFPTDKSHAAADTERSANSEISGEMLVLAEPNGSVDQFSIASGLQQDTLQGSVEDDKQSKLMAAQEKPWGVDELMLDKVPSGSENLAAYQTRERNTSGSFDQGNYRAFGRSTKSAICRSDLAASWRREPSGYVNEQLQNVETISRNLPRGSANAENYQLF